MLPSLIASLLLTAPPAIAVPESFKEPGPLRICIKARLNENGHFTRLKIDEGSGKSKIDREAVKFLGIINVKRIRRVPIKTHSGYTVLRATDADPPTFTLTGLELRNDCSETSVTPASTSDATSGPVEPTERPRRDELEVIAIAKEAAQKSGYDPNRYGPPEVRYEPVEEDRTWSVIFHGLNDVIGNHFLVVVDDRTGRAALHGGL